MDSFQAFVIASPFISAGIAGFLNYSFGTKAKRKEYLYQNRIDSFKQIALKISELNKYCHGKISLIQGNEFSPFYDLDGSGLSHRTSIADTVEYHQIFLTKTSRTALNNLLNQMAFICNVELHNAGSNEFVDDPAVYEATMKEAQKCMDTIYQELGLD